MQQSHFRQALAQRGHVYVAKAFVGRDRQWACRVEMMGVRRVGPQEFQFITNLPNLPDHGVHGGRRVVTERNGRRVVGLSSTNSNLEQPRGTNHGKLAEKVAFHETWSAAANIAVSMYGSC